LAARYYRLTDDGHNALLHIWQLYESNGGNVTEAVRSIQGIKRETISKLLNRREHCQFDKIRILFEGINSKLEDFGVQGRDLREFIDNQYCEPVVSSLPVQKSSLIKVPIEQQVANLLCRLDYKKQEISFDQCLTELDYAGAFLVRAPDLQVQKWLIKRLAIMAAITQGQRKKALFYPIVLKSIHPMCWDPNELWSELGKQVNATGNREIIIQTICERASVEPLILSLYGITYLTNDVQQSLWNFWCDLVNHFSNLPSRKTRGRIILFLADDVEEACSNPVNLNQVIPTQDFNIPL
jgi:hypothetical protein